MPDFRAGTPWGEALRALDPILAAEKERGNRGRIDPGDSRDNRPGFRMQYPLDVNALKVQFEFGDGIEITQGAPAGLHFRGPGGGVVNLLLRRAGDGWAITLRDRSDVRDIAFYDSEGIAADAFVEMVSRDNGVT